MAEMVDAAPRAATSAEDTEANRHALWNAAKEGRLLSERIPEVPVVFDSW